ncbi:hypothetical protein ACWPOB_22805 [Rhodococcus sp. 2H158]
MEAEKTLDALADALFGAIERGDADAFLACFEKGGVIVKNGGDRRSAGSVACRLDGRPADSARHRYSAVRREFFEAGFVEEHEVHSSLPGGGIEVRHACVVGNVGDGGLLKELREYVGG